MPPNNYRSTDTVDQALGTLCEVQTENAPQLNDTLPHSSNISK